MRLEDAFLNDLASGFRIDIFGVGEDMVSEEQVTRPPAQEMAVAADDFTQMATEMAGGTEPPGATPMTLGEFATSAADVPAGLLKGAIQGTIGLPGDIESLAYGVRELFRRGADESRFDAFLRGIESGTVMPTTEDVKKWMDTNVGPLVPAGASERRREAAKIPEFVGELGAMGELATRATKGTARAAGQIGREIATTPPTGAVQMAPTPVQALKSEIGFYSAVEETVANLPQAKGTGQQFLAQISKTAGVKPEELQWTGLDEFLKGKKSVTKAEVQDYLAANRVDVQEVRLGEMSPEQSLAISQAKNRYREITDAVADTRQKVEEGLLSSQEARVILEPLTAERSRLDNQILSNAAPATKFSQYTLPGGKNYREILLTLPTDATRLRAEGDRISRLANPTPEEIETFRRANVAGASEFRSSHFTQPNVLAHMRVNDRVVDGKKTLFIEEIQSDWHQAGRKKGYADAEKPYEVFDPKDGNVIATFKTEKEAKAYADKLGPNVDYAKSEGVPDAPFKTTWHELSLKRAIQEASEKGYDQIAFTTGKTQAERYDLSKQVDYIDYRKSPDGTFELGIADINGDAVDLPKARYTAEELPDVVGKEIADRIVSGQGQSGGGRMTLRGVDLQVGGEGMKGFYDQILPKSLEKLGKKFDAKVGKTEMDGVEVWQMDITPKMRESAMSKGQPLFVAPVVAPGMVQDEESK
jgi:hypothetical protein